MCARRVWCSEQITTILQNNYKIITNCNTIQLQNKYPIHYYPPNLDQIVIPQFITTPQIESQSDTKNI